MLAVNPPRPVKRPEDFPSFSRPQPLSLRLENGLLQHRTRVRAPQCHRKKPRLGFFRLSNETHPANRRQPAQPRRKIGPAPMKTASGIPYWPSRDPIGERGGMNLYGFVGNDGVDRNDLLGLLCDAERKRWEETQSGLSTLRYLTENASQRLSSALAASENRKSIADQLREQILTYQSDGSLVQDLGLEVLKQRLVGALQSFQQSLPELESAMSANKQAAQNLELAYEKSDRALKAYQDCMGEDMPTVPDKDGVGICTLKCMFGKNLVNYARGGALAGNVGSRIAMRVVATEATKVALKKVATALTGAGLVVTGGELTYCFTCCSLDPNRYNK